MKLATWLSPGYPISAYAYSHGIEAAVAELPAPERVTVLGQVSTAEKSALMRQADLFVQPNVPVAGDMEGFGLVVLEAAVAKVDGRLFYAQPKYCTDNGAMIAYAGAQRLRAGQVDEPDVRVRPRWPMEELPPLKAGSG